MNTKRKKLIYKAAWYCLNCLERKEAMNNEKFCPDCGEKMQQCSRYEWFLFDELKHWLSLKLSGTGRKYKLEAQYPIEDVSRGFTWYFDLRVWVTGESIFGGYGEFIEVDGIDHKRQKQYTGPGGGYTRDVDKEWNLFNNHRYHKRGYELRRVSNEECSKKDNAVQFTAIEIVDELIERADTWC